MSNTADGRLQRASGGQQGSRGMQSHEKTDVTPLTTQQFIGHLGQQDWRNRSSQNAVFEESYASATYGAIPNRSFDAAPRFKGQHAQQPQYHQQQHQQHQHHQQQHHQIYYSFGELAPPPPQSPYGGGYSFLPLRPIGRSQQPQPQSPRSRPTSNVQGHTKKMPFDTNYEGRPINVVSVVSYVPVEEATPFLEQAKPPSFGTILSGKQKSNPQQKKPYTEKPTSHKTSLVVDTTQIHGKGHRRVSSDGSYLQSIQEGLPPFSPSVRSRGQVPIHNRPRERSHSAHSNKPRHRRGDSASSIASLSSVLSERSVVSDIRKSTLYKEVTDSGVVRMHLPFDNVRLVMDHGLETGAVYKRITHKNEAEQFLIYHLHSNDQVGNWQDLMDSNLDELPGCSCTCEHCSACNHKANTLPPMSYVLAVDCDLYRRVLGEISDSKEMPCGLFFCGHHEDVSRPSIFIAVTIVAFVFGVLFVLTYISGY